MSESLTAQAAELLVKQVQEEFDQGTDNLSRAFQNIVVPHTIGQEPSSKDSVKYPYEQMVKLYLYRLVRGYSQNEVIKKLNTQRYLQRRFGFTDKVPRQQTLSNAECNRFSPETKRALYAAAQAIAREADERDVIIPELSPELLEPDDDGTEEERSKRDYKREQSQKSVRFARKHAIPHFETGRADNKSYTDTEIFDVLARMCATTGSANSEGEYGWITDEDYTPDGSTILRAMEKIGTPGDEAQQVTFDELLESNESPELAKIRDAVISSFDTATENIISSINGDTPFSDREVVAAIDVTYERIHISPWEDYEKGIPNEDFPKLASGYKKSDDPYDDDKGEIRYGFKYATLAIVGDNAPIILGVEPLKENSAWEPDDAVSYSLADVVDRLLQKAQQFVDIDVLLCDREFYAHPVFNTIHQHGTTYIIPKKKYEDDYANIDKIEEHPTADAAVQHNVTSSDGDRSHKSDFLYVPSSEEDGKYAVFATNQRVEPENIEPVVGKYQRRWDIENGFKSIKDFKPRTSSMGYRVRFIIFGFCCSDLQSLATDGLLGETRIGYRNSG